MTETDEGDTAPRYELLRSTDHRCVRWHIWKADRIASADSRAAAERLIALLEQGRAP